MLRIIFLISALLLAGPAAACSCVDAPLDTASARAARHVFVFRVISTMARDEPTVDGRAGYHVSAKIRVLANVRGKTTTRELDYWIHRCCGIRLEAGKDYIGFLHSDGTSFQASHANVLPLWDRFTRPEADDLEAVLRGKAKLEEVFASGLSEIHQVPPPPLPCPAR
jgi:hypothetical protein